MKSSPLPLQVLSEAELDTVAGGMNMNGQELSSNVIDVRTPIRTTGDFARYDRSLDALYAAWS